MLFAASLLESTGTSTDSTCTGAGSIFGVKSSEGLLK
jgi:hypothetical protein